MASLNDEVKAFIVRGLANFSTPTEVIELVKKEYGITLTTAQVSYYNPKTKNGAKLKKQWSDLFYEFREQAKTDVGDLWIAHLPQRLKKYQDEFEKTKNPKLKLEILKQSAQDLGGIFVNDSTISEEEKQSNAQPVNVIVEVKDARKNAEFEYSTSQVFKSTE